MVRTACGGAWWELALGKLALHIKNSLARHPKLCHDSNANNHQSVHCWLISPIIIDHRHSDMLALIKPIYVVMSEYMKLCALAWDCTMKGISLQFAALLRCLEICSLILCFVKLIANQTRCQFKFHIYLSRTFRVNLL